MVVVTAAWLDQSYEEAAQSSEFSYTYIQRHVGPKLWAALTSLYGNKVTKKRLRSIVEGHAGQSFQVQETPLSESKKPKATILGSSLPSGDFYGRSPELASLRASVLDSQCLLLMGQAGIGKTALVAQLVEQLQYDPNSPDVFIWKPLYDSPHLNNLVIDLLNLLSIFPEHTLELQVQQLIEAFKDRRILLILDGIDRLLEGNPPDHPYGNHGDYGWFFKKITIESHQSCLLLTSREPLDEVTWLSETGQSARISRVEGLGKDARLILKVAQLRDADEWGTLIQIYRGNPLSLKMVASQISKFFNGKVSQFLECKTTWIGEPLKQALDIQVKSGTALEKGLLIFLAKELREADSLSFNQVLTKMKTSGPTQSTTEIMGTIEVLCTRSLLERSTVKKKEVRISMQPVIQKYILTDPSGILHDSQAA